MSKDWGKRWGDEALERGFERLIRRTAKCWDENGDLIMNGVIEPTYLRCKVDKNVALKLDPRFDKIVRTKMLLGITKNIKLRSHIPYRTASIKPEHITSELEFSGFKAVAEYKGSGIWTINVRRK